MPSNFLCKIDVMISNDHVSITFVFLFFQGSKDNLLWKQQIIFSLNKLIMDECDSSKAKHVNQLMKFIDKNFSKDDYLGLPIGYFVFDPFKFFCDLNIKYLFIR